MTLAKFGCGLLGALLPAQQAPLVHASGGADSGVAAAQVRAADDAAQWQLLWQAHRPGQAPPALDFARACAVAAFAGEAPAAEVRIAELLRGEAGAVLRLQPVAGEGPGRAFGIFALRRGGAPLAVEQDVAWHRAGPPQWQPAPLPAGLCIDAPLPAGVQLPRMVGELDGLQPESNGAQWLDDLVALRRVPGGRKLDVEVDFGRCGVLLVRTMLLSGRRLQWQPPLLAADGIVLRLLCTDAGADAAEGPQPHTRAFVVERPRRPLRVELGDDAADGRWREFARLEPADPATAKRLFVLRQAGVYDCGATQPFCRRLETAAELRALQQELRLPASLVDGFDAEHDVVIAVATGSGRVFDGFGVAVASEEDVDVLTLLQSAPSGRDPGVHTPLVLLQLPRRPNELAVVLRLGSGPAPASEETLAHFPGLK